MLHRKLLYFQSYLLLENNCQVIRFFVPNGSQIFRISIPQNILPKKVSTNWYDGLKTFLCIEQFYLLIKVEVAISSLHSSPSIFLQFYRNKKQHLSHLSMHTWHRKGAYLKFTIHISSCHFCSITSCVQYSTTFYAIRNYLEMALSNKKVHISQKLHVHCFIIHRNSSYFPKH